MDQSNQSSIADTARRITRSGANRWRRIGRRTYTAGSVAFIAIGALHTFVQSTDMAAPVIRGQLEQIGAVAGVGAEAWDLWQGLGLLMGFFSLALGATNLAARRLGEDPNPAICVINISMLAAVTTIGAVHLGPLQLVGGPVGIAMFSVPLVGAVLARRA